MIEIRFSDKNSPLCYAVDLKQIIIKQIQKYKKKR